MHEEERKGLLEEAKTQPFNRGKLADKATRTGTAYGKGNQQEADKWFALAAEIRGTATDVVVLSKPVVEISHEEVALVEEVETVSVKDEKIEPEPAKIYYCKKCDFSTPDRFILVGHYSSVHSWHHVDKQRHMPLGRPPTGKQLTCPDCGKEIYVKKCRLDTELADKVHYCKECANKRYQPPKRVKAVQEERQTTETRVREETKSLSAKLTRKICYKAEPRLGDFSILVTSDDLAKLDDDGFFELWLLLGNVIRNRFVEVESDLR